MAERPLLLFPTPESASRSPLGGGSGSSRTPTPQRQWDRLSPTFTQLQTAFHTRSVEIQQNAAGIDPEQVLVIETVGSIEAFANAVKRIDGFEWMSEIEVDEIAPDEDFFDEKRPEKELSGRLYFVMTNQRALDEMLSLWRRYHDNPDLKFEIGLTKFRDVFLHLKSIRKWDVQDRLQETRIIEYWEEDLQHDGGRVITFEAELWFRGSAELRQSSAAHVTTLVQQFGGRILSQSIIEGIAYHAVLAELPANAVRSIIASPTTELVRCENIMFFRPSGQMVVGETPPEGDVEIAPIDTMPVVDGAPVIALLDGLPLANHELLAGRIQVDDPDNWEADYAASERVHGTSMASLIIHGDINAGTAPLTRPIYVRPIMKPYPSLSTPRPEGIPENCLAADLIHRAVVRIFDGEQGEAPVAPQVRVINLSIGDRSRQFSQSMSPLARLLDWLSAKYNVLFIVSVGNHVSPITMEASGDDFDSLSPSELEAATIRALYQDTRHRKMLSPAETINGITVGAAHHDYSQEERPGNQFDPFEQMLPSPVSAFGSGYRRAIKPDVIFSGGKQWYRRSLQQTNPVTIEPAIFRVAPGNKVAFPGDFAGGLTATSYSCGTSNATALASRAAGTCYDLLQQIFDDQDEEIDFRAYEVSLLKAMLVHGSSWGDLSSRISEVLSTPESSNQIRGLVSRWMGYGVPQVDRVLDCTEQRATLLGFGQLSDGEANVFRLPLPPSLGSRPEWRRLTVTMAWLSPISANTQKYRTASLWFGVGGVSVAKDRKEGCSGNDGWRAVRRGTVQHEVFEGNRAEPFIDGDVIEIKVNCRKDAGKINGSIAFGLVVSLEVSEGVDIAVYNEVRAGIRTPVQIRQGPDIE